MNYNNSDVKYVIDTWVSSNFKSGDLKLIDGYRARLLSIDDLVNNLGYSWEIVSAGLPIVNGNVPKWVYNHNYQYWTMSQYEDYVASMRVVDGGGTLSSLGILAYFGVIRPVINVNKTAIQS